MAGIAVADQWRARLGDSAQVVFVGAQGGIEEKLVPRAGYRLELLRLGSLNRVSLARKLKTYVQLPFSLLRSLTLVLRLKPAVVLGVGGYASGPVVLVARLLRGVGLTRAYTAILEQNSVPGFTNRLLGRWVDRVYCAFPGTEARFAAGRTSVSGNPTRAAMKRLGPGPTQPFTVFIFGGSLGALGVNSLVIEALQALGARLGEFRFVHQTGERDFERVQAAHQAAGSLARVEKFIHAMHEAYREASVVVCRAGASTLSELAAVGRAAILVPLPTAADNHQEVNARVFSGKGAAELLVQSHSTGVDLARLLLDLKDHPERLRAMEAAVTAFDRPEAARDIAQGLSQGAGL